jgi:hypothetical protein
MRTMVVGQVNLFSVFLVTIGLLALAALVIFVGIHLFLAGVSHYAPWEQIWAG